MIIMIIMIITTWCTNNDDNNNDDNTNIKQRHNKSNVHVGVSDIYRNMFKCFEEMNLHVHHCSSEAPAAGAAVPQAHRRNRNPRPQPLTFSKLVFPIWLGQSCIRPSFLSGALIGGRGVPASLVRRRPPFFFFLLLVWLLLLLLFLSSLIIITVPMAGVGRGAAVRRAGRAPLAGRQRRAQAEPAERPESW